MKKEREEFVCLHGMDRNMGAMSMGLTGNISSNDNYS